MISAFRSVILVTTLATALTGAAAAVPASATTAGGTRIWLARYHAPGQTSPEDAGLAVSPDGSTVFVTGTVQYPTNQSFVATNAYNASTGAQVWSARYYGASHRAGATAIAADGSTVFVTSAIDAGGLGTGGYAVVAYDASTGARLWASTYKGPAGSYNTPTAMALSRNGSEVVVTGMSEFVPSGTNSADYRVATVAYGTSTGAFLWAKRDILYGAPGGSQDVAISPDGSQVIVASSGENLAESGSAHTTEAYSAATGSRLWTAPNHGPGGSSIYLAVSPDGSQVFVTTTEVSPAGFPGYLTMAYAAATGTTQWKQTYAVAREASFPVSIAVSPDGSAVFVTGVLNTSRQSQMGTFAYASATGAQLWKTTYPSHGARAGAQSIAVSPDGSQVFLAGYISTDFRGAPVNGFATVALDASTGAPLWVGKYFSAKGGVPSGVVASPTGNSVFVSGTSSYGSALGKADVYATLAYSVTG